MQFPNWIVGRAPIWAKLRNYRYLRCGIKIGVRINGSRFHYGQLLCSWHPNFRNNSVSYQASVNNVISQSGNPCFMMSASENEVHEMTFPFALPYLWINLQDLVTYDTALFASPWEIGSFNIYVLNPLRNAGTPTDITFSVFASLDNPQVAGYCTDAYAPPAVVAFEQASFPAILMTAPTPPLSFKAQGRREAKVKSEKGIIGKIAEGVAGIAGSLVPIPEIGEVAAGVSVGARVVAGIANYFGWSRPNTLQAIQPVRLTYTNMANTHGLMDGQCLSVDPENGVATACELMGALPEEMQLLRMASTPGLAELEIPWTASDTTGTCLYKVGVGPGMTHSQLVGGTTTQFSTPLLWTTQPFLMWRGSIRVHITIVCSQMHVGRLRVSFLPNLDSGTTLALDDLVSSPGRVIDISKETEVDITFPYIHYSPWLPVVQSMGQMRINVINMLVHPSAPAPNVALNVWVAAGPDYQLARPSSTYLNCQWVDPLKPPFEAEAETPPKVFRAQGLTREQIRAAHAMPLIPAKGSIDTGLTMGEQVGHLKELLMRPTIGVETVPVGGNFQYVNCKPFSQTIRQTSGSPYTSFMDYFKLMFRYQRGSINYHMVTTSVSEPATQPTGWYFAENNATVAAGNITATTFGPQFLTAAVPYPFALLATGHEGAAIVPNGSHGMPIVVNTPFYCSSYFIPNFFLKNTLDTSPMVYFGEAPSVTIFSANGGHLFVGAGDDFEFGFQIGPPPIIL